MRKLLIPLIIIAVSIYNHGIGHAVKFLFGITIGILLLAGLYAGGKEIWHKIKN